MNTLENDLILDITGQKDFNIEINTTPIETTSPNDID